MNSQRVSAAYGWLSNLRLPKGLLGGWTLLIFLFLYLPIILLIVYSFNDAKFGVAWQGFTFRWYDALFHNEPVLRAFKNSLIVASFTTVASVILGVIGGWSLYRYRFPAQGFLDLLIFIPIVIPEVLMGVSLLILFVLVQVPLGYVTVIIAHITFCFPFVLVAIQARLAGLDPSLEEAAQDLGATPAEAFRLVIVPYLMPAIISGALLSFTLSMDEYIVTVFTAGADSQTLPLRVYGMAKVGMTPQLNALSALFVAGTMLLVIVSEIAKRRQSAIA